MYLQCPACSQTLAASEEHCGQVVQCPHCREEIQIPASPAPAAQLAEALDLVSASELSSVPAPINRPAPATAPELATAPEPTKKCPYCGGTILKVAVRCKHCKEEIPRGFDEESAAERLKMKEALVAQQAAGGDHKLPYSVTGWFQIPTLVLVALTPPVIATSAYGFSQGERSDLFFLGPVGFFVGILVVVFALIFLGRDLSAGKYFGRKTPLKGARAFLKGLCAKRYLFAYYCVLDADKCPPLRLRPAMIKFNLDSNSYSFDTFEGFRDYWKTTLHSKGTQAVVRAIHLERAQGDFAEVSAVIKLSRQSTTGFLALGVLGALLFATNDTLHVKKLFRLVDGQWYAVNGELDSGEDRFGFALLTH